MFIENEIYLRRELHRIYGGQQQGGISTPAKHKFIMLFTSVSGEAYGYQDGWTKDGVFFYSGEGQIGDMSFVRGNLAIKEHVKNGEELHLFENVNAGRVRYIGQMVCTGFHVESKIDSENKLRKAIVFEMTPTTSR